MTAIEKVVVQDIEAMATIGAEQVAATARAAIAERGSCHLVLAGGSTPKPLYRELTTAYQESIDWSRVYIWIGDERRVPLAHRASNFRMAHHTLLQHVPIQWANVFPIPTGHPTLAACAAAYDRRLASAFAANIAASTPTFDLVLLGLGTDGHTASLFPGDEAATQLTGDPRLAVPDGVPSEAGGPWARAAKAPPPAPQSERITLTIPAIAKARQVMFLVAGKDKTAQLTGRAGQSLLAQEITAVEGVTWLVAEG